MGLDQRHYTRMLVQRFGGFRVMLDGGEKTEALLIDISPGGMKILIRKDAADLQLSPGSAVSGEIDQGQGALRLPFSAAVSWQRPSDFEGQAATALGLSFADYVQLPDALMHLVENYEAV